MNGGQLPVPGMTGGLALPKLGLGEIVAAVKLDQGKATFEKLEARGGDADFTAEGLYAVLQPRLQFAPLAGKAKLRVKDAFWAKRETQAFKGVAEAALASSRGRDGAWSFQHLGERREAAAPPGARGAVGLRASVLGLGPQAPCRRTSRPPEPGARMALTPGSRDHTCRCHATPRSHGRNRTHAAQRPPRRGENLPAIKGFP